MSSILLIISIVILSLLSIYGALYLFLGLSVLFVARKKSNYVAAGKENGEVAVLIPSRNEGEALLDAISSLHSQDYRGRISIYVLVKNEEDSSWPYLQAKIASNKDSWQRKINVVFCGEDAKSKKLNFILPSIEAPYVAILDADHRPSANWVSSSLFVMEKEKALAVQTRRAPLDVSSLPQIWDSSQNHSGNELLNFNLSFFGKSVFFTGTAALFKREVFQNFSFSSSLTEDTFLSYDILVKGGKIAYNNQAVSYEEVAPSLRAYIFRRRRWSTGHNQTFFTHLWAILKSKSDFLQKTILLLHAQFYLIPLLVLILLGVYGLHFFLQLSINYQIVVVLLSLFFSLLLSSLFKQGDFFSWLDFILSFIYLLPQVAIFSIFALRFSGVESYYYILSFPLAKDLIYWQSILFLAPLAPIVASVFIFKTFRQKQNLWILPTYPISLFFDIYAALLGFIDLLFSRTKWSVIKRTNRYSASLLPQDVKDNLSIGEEREDVKNKVYIFSIIALLVLFLANDLLATNNCGEVKKFLWRPVIFQPNSDLNLDIKLIKTALDDGKLRVDAPLKLSGAPDNFNLDIYLDGQLKESKKVENGDYIVFTADYPYGFNKHDIIFKFENNGLNNQASCYRKFYFSNTLKEIKGKDFFLNGEKFLIKGMIPSFLGGKSGLSMEEGFKQIKEIGINSLRFYHGASKEIMELAAKHGLLIMDQPDRSTWGDFSPFNNYQSEKFLERYGELLDDHEGEPFSLWTSFGNEWELGESSQPVSISGAVNQLINKANKKFFNFPTTYSTYYTFIDYSVDIAAINMLDTGSVYWRQVMQMLSDAKKPFYASEFGGFVAFFEDTDSEIRYNRLLNEWNALLKAGAIGANFFQSHDNWAQPLVSGYNDPGKDEKADDKRGFFTNKNKEKLELGALQEILSDFTVSIDKKKIKDCSSTFSLNIKNKRDYNIKGAVLKYHDKEITLGDFSPLESRDFDVDLGKISDKDFPLDLAFSYTTHSGLASASKVEAVLPCYGASVLILNPDFQTESRSEKNIYGRLVASGNLNVFLPSDWQNFIVNGKEYKKEGDFIDIKVGGPYYDVLEMATSRDKGEWKPFDDKTEIKDGGLFYGRFKWPETSGNKSLLILSGLGADKVTFYIDAKAKEFSTHNYRENIINASDIGNPKPGDVITFSINRNQNMYVSRQSALNYEAPIIAKDDIWAILEKPRVFSPTIVNLEKMP